MGKAEKLPDYSKPTKFIPGPGEYETAKSTLLSNENAVKFGPDRKISLGIDPKTPGPGTYNQSAYYNGGTLNQPQTVFGKSSRSQSMNTLGPGRNLFNNVAAIYTHKTELEQSVDKGKGYLMGTRYKIK